MGSEVVRYRTTSVSGDHLFFGFRSPSHTFSALPDAFEKKQILEGMAVKKQEMSNFNFGRWSKWLPKALFLEVRPMLVAVRKGPGSVSIFDFVATILASSTFFEFVVMKTKRLDLGFCAIGKYQMEVHGYFIALLFVDRFDTSGDESFSEI